MTPTFLSIDWDFFHYRAREAPDPGTWKNNVGEDIALLPFFDWQSSESRGGALQSIIWSMRFLDIKRVGLDPYVITGPVEELGCTKPETFLEVLEQRYKMDEVWNVVFSDSHRHAYYGVQDAFHDNDDKPISVVHFDAHHDLGYVHKTVQQHQKQEVYDCADWLLAAMHAGMISDLTVVYPNWRGATEEIENFTEDKVAVLIRSLPVTLTTWDDWVKAGEQKSQAPVSSVHIARSGAWVPPWFDKDFMKFWQSFGAKGELACAECMYNEDGLHGCEEREWAEPEDHFNMLKKMG